MQKANDRFWDAGVAIPVICHNLPSDCLTGMRLAAGVAKVAFKLLGRLESVALHFPLDAHQEIEMHAFGFEPAFERVA